MVKKREQRELSVRGFGFATGIITAVLVLLFVLVAQVYPLNFALIEEIYGPASFGATGFAQGLIFTVYGFIDGLIFGAVFAWVYNKFL